MFKLFTRIFFALVCGLVLSLWVLQNTPSVKEFVSTKIIQFLEKDWAAHIDTESVKVNFFTFSLWFKNGKITPADEKKYAWQFEQCRVQLSMLDFIFKRKLSLNLIFNNIKASAIYTDKKPDLLTHIQGIFTPKDLDFKIKLTSVTFNNIDLIVNVPGADGSTAHTLDLHFPGSLAVYRQKPKELGWAGKATISGASLLYDQKPFVHQVAGDVSFARNSVDKMMQGTVALTTKSQLLDTSKVYTINGSWNSDTQSFVLANQTGDVHLTTTLSSLDHIAVQGKIPLQSACHCYSYINDKPLEPSFIPQGSCLLDLTLHKRDNTYTPQGLIAIQKLAFGNYAADQVVFSIKDFNQQNIRANVDVILSPEYHFGGTIVWDWLKEMGTISLGNMDHLSMSQFISLSAYAHMSIQPHGLSARAFFDTHGLSKGTYHCNVIDQSNDKLHTYKGAFVWDNNNLGFLGKAGKGLYNIKAGLTPHPHVTECIYTVGDHDVVSMKSSAQDPLVLEGSVRWSFVRLWLNKNMRRLVFNKNCVFNVSINQHNYMNLHGALKLTHGQFFIPDFHNLIHDLQCTYAINFPQRQITVDDLGVTLSQGTITCPRATVLLGADYGITMIHAPLAVSNLFVNWKREFYASIYGTLLINKIPTNEYPLLSGNIVLRKSLLKNAFFLNQAHGTALDPSGPLRLFAAIPVDLDLKVMTEKPIKTKLPTLEALVSLDVAIRNKAGNGLYSAPKIVGNVTLDNGFIRLFRNKLRLEYGKIQLVAGSINDPLIDIVAKNRIGKYLVTLQISGSQQKPTIQLESMPDLGEEQILGLLLAGSEHVTLQEGLPSMLLSNLDTLLFDKKKHSKTALLVDKLSKTFKYIQISPNFSDDPNQSKLKGSVSVNLNDQLRAQIQKNFDLQSEFSAQLEYSLSDDINLKVIKDQCGELGSEVEMRLKLG